MANKIKSIRHDKTKNELTVVIATNKEPEPSKSGKNKILCTTGGNIPTQATYNQSPIVLGLTAYFKE